MFYLMFTYALCTIFYSFTYLDQIGNQVKVPNPLFQPSLPKDDLSKELLQKKETTKIISIQEPEQGKIYVKII